MVYRYTEPRFFDTEDQARRAGERAGGWNVFRPLDFEGQAHAESTRGGTTHRVGPVC